MVKRHSLKGNRKLLFLFFMKRFCQDEEWTEDESTNSDAVRRNEGCLCCLLQNRFLFG
ncbi:hypothetical protein GT23_1716 [Parageobacillus thermoglucosidasius]|nr:hypothetical protein GT23_1716 [Parageobacillus thermoglucosidasius]